MDISSLPPATDGQQSAELPPSFELQTDASGVERWKLTCFCGKRIMAPVQGGPGHGRCPKCLRLLRLPREGETATGAVTLPAVAPVQGVAEWLDAETAPAPSPADSNARAFSLQAAATAADRLRPKTTESRNTASGSGFISAWPVAGKPRRLTAAMIDLAIAVTVAGTIAVIDAWTAQAPAIEPLALAAWVVVAGFGCDALLPLILGSTPGKRLVVLAIRHASGGGLSVAQLFVRALCKWVLFPGWIWALWDPSDRTVHDMVCGTLVLKGRTRR